MSETKPTADIEGASFIHMHDGWHMMGRISNHDRQSDFHSPVQMTSKLLRIDFENNTAETLNTHYRLV